MMSCNLSLMWGVCQTTQQRNQISARYFADNQPLNNCNLSVYFTNWGKEIIYLLLMDQFKQQNVLLISKIEYTKE